MPNMQNPEWEIFYVNQTSGPCDQEITEFTGVILRQSIDILGIFLFKSKVVWGQNIVEEY